LQLSAGSLSIGTSAMPGLLRPMLLPMNSRRVEKEKPIGIQQGRQDMIKIAGKRTSLYKRPENL
jgi:hypothetical protein